MKITELYSALDSVIPKSLSCEWDNDGVMCMPDPDREVKKVLLALDVTHGVVEYAIKGGFDLVITHHPMIFKPIKSVSDPKIIMLVKNGISVFSFHTRLDKLEGGVNTALAELLDLSDVSRFGEDNLGIIGEFENELSPSELALYVKEKLGAPFVQCVLAEKKCKKIALVGGSGDDYIEAALENGADAYISGELGYNDMTDADNLGITLIAAGHYYTEVPVLNKLEEMIKKLDQSIYAEKIDCNIIKAI